MRQFGEILNLHPLALYNVYERTVDLVSDIGQVTFFSPCRTPAAPHAQFTEAILTYITVDRDKCSGLGMCESAAPDVFEVDDDGILHLKPETLADDRASHVARAVANCPLGALRMQP